MAFEVKIPPIGESITEGTIARWLKQDGDAVREGDSILELETEKATSEMPAPASGTLHIKARAGDTVAVGGVVATIDEDKSTRRSEKTETPPKKKPEKEQQAKEKPEKEEEKE